MLEVRNINTLNMVGGGGGGKKKEVIRAHIFTCSKK